MRTSRSPTRAVVIWDRPRLLALAPAGVPLASFDAVPELTAGGSRFSLDGVEVELTVPGVHNACNAAAALTAARLAGADPAAAAAALRDFEGAGRRFERLGTTPQGATVVDDYAHHPTEVAATLAAARTLAPRRLIAVFQPHLYSRTARQAAEFGAALAAADEVVVLDVYPARERAQDYPGVSGLLVAQAAADAAGGRPVAWLPTLAQAQELLAEHAARGRSRADAGRRRRRRARVARSSPGSEPHRTSVSTGFDPDSRTFVARADRAGAGRTLAPGAELNCMARSIRLPWRVLAGVLLAVIGLALGWLWFRDSSFAAVERITITGSGSSERDRVHAALESTATGMSTLRVDEQALAAGGRAVRLRGRPARAAGFPARPAHRGDRARAGRRRAGRRQQRSGDRRRAAARGRAGGTTCRRSRPRRRSPAVT